MRCFNPAKAGSHRHHAALLQLSTPASRSRNSVSRLFRRGIRPGCPSKVMVAAAPNFSALASSDALHPLRIRVSLRTCFHPIAAGAYPPFDDQALSDRRARLGIYRILRREHERIPAPCVQTISAQTKKGAGRISDALRIRLARCGQARNKVVALARS